MAKNKLSFNEWLMTEYGFDEDEFSRYSKQERVTIKKQYEEYLKSDEQLT